jgi:hypothetical protein
VGIMADCVGACVGTGADVAGSGVGAATVGASPQPANTSAAASKMKMYRTVISFEQMTKYSVRKRLLYSLLG